MVKAIIDISSHTNKILTIFKVEHGLRDKSEAIEKMVEEYKNLAACPTCGVAYGQHNVGPGAANELDNISREGKFRPLDWKRIEKK